jgi:hypothetical protein
MFIKAAFITTLALAAVGVHGGDNMCKLSTHTVANKAFINTRQDIIVHQQDKCRWSYLVTVIINHLSE